MKRLLAKKTRNQYFKSPFNPFFSIKNLHSDNPISINNKDKTAGNEVKLVKLFKTYFVNVVKYNGKSYDRFRGFL